MSLNSINKKQHLVIVGNGLASQRLLTALVKSGAPYRITVLSSEAMPGYNRIMLSSLLAGETDLADITAMDEVWYRQQGIDLRLSCTVVAVDAEQQLIHSANGNKFAYDKLILATGSRALMPDVPGNRLDGVMGFRDMADVKKMLDYCQHEAITTKKAVVAGGGLLGIEAAVGLASQGVKVTLLHRNAVLMNRQIDDVASGFLITALQQRGIEVITQASVDSLHGHHGHVETVCVKNTENQRQEIAADLVVFATGIVPVVIPFIAGNAAGIEINRGIVVNAQMQTANTSVYALGECIEFEGSTFGLVAPVWQQADVLSRVLVGEKAQYRHQSYITKLKVSGIDLHCMGDVKAEGEELTLTARDSGIYKRIVLKNNRIVSALLLGDVADSQWYFELMQSETDIQSIRQSLLFGKAFVNEQNQSEKMAGMGNAA